MRGIARALAATASTMVLAVGLVAPSGAAPVAPDFGETATSWDLAADRLGLVGSIWEPMRTFGLDRRGALRVLARGLAIGQNAPIAGDTTVLARYAKGSQSLDVAEKWANTGWVRAPRRPSRRGLVAHVRIRMSVPFAYSLPALVYANCGKRRCSQADVLDHGGQLEMTARGATTMTEPSQTSVVLTANGLTFSQLVSIARGLEQVQGTIAHGAGSAQMQAMCRQMVTAAMAPEVAIAFAEENQYSARVGTIDGVPQALTLDYRQGRFTLAVAANAVTGCTYE